MELKFYKRDFLDFLLSTKTLKNTGETEKNSTPFAIKYAELNTGTGLKAVGHAIAESLHDIYSKKGINVVICDDNEILPFVITATLLFTESFKKELRFIDAQKQSEKKISKLLNKGDKIVVIGSRTSSYKLFSHLRKITEKNKDLSLLGCYTIIGSKGANQALITLKDINAYYQEARYGA